MTTPPTPGISEFRTKECAIEDAIKPNLVLYRENMHTLSVKTMMCGRRRGVEE